MDDYPVLYVFVREDLQSMNPGKAQAHSGHAACAFMYEMMKDAPAGASVSGAYIATRKKFKEWAGSTDHGFGTQINLSVPFDFWNQIVIDAARIGCDGDVIFDPTYPIATTSEIASHIPQSVRRVVNGDNAVLLVRECTAGYVFGMKSELDPIMGGFGLAP